MCPIAVTVAQLLRKTFSVHATSCMKQPSGLSGATPQFTKNDTTTLVILAVRTRRFGGELETDTAEGPGDPIPLVRPSV
jgi:hypothetical protein